MLIEPIFAAETPRAVKAKALAEVIRPLRAYRWGGIYDLGPEFASAIAWSGPEGPYSIASVVRLPAPTVLKNPLKLEKSAIYAGFWCCGCAKVCRPMQEKYAF